MSAFSRALVLTVGFVCVCGMSARLVGETPAKPRSAQKSAKESRPAVRKPAKSNSPAVANVNGEPITEDDVRFMMLSHGVQGSSPEIRAQILERLIERSLIRQFLAGRKAEVDPKQLDDAVGQLKRQLKEEGRDPEAALKEMGFDDARIREDLSLTLAWQGHVRRIATSTEIQEYFASHREEFDGTEVRASQIFKKLPENPGAPELTEIQAKLTELREQIAAGKLNFADAAKEYSDAPSKEKGGDVGWFPYRGKMPPELSSVAFRLKKGEMSQPFRTRFGVHLLTVTDRKAGEISVEDARPEILRALSDAHWRKVVEQERAKAKIERKEAQG